MRTSRVGNRGNRAWEAKSLIRREHPTAADLEAFELQTDLQSWHFLPWEKEEQLNRLWYRLAHTEPNRVK